MDHDEISALMIASKKYEEYRKMKLPRGDPSMTTTKFPTDMTPIILASQRNQYSVVKMLLDRGEKISVPHHAYCSCVECQTLLAECDELEVAKIRLYTYRGLASDAYISLNCADPILEAFQLRQTLRKNAEIEKYFKVRLVNDLWHAWGRC